MAREKGSSTIVIVILVVIVILLISGFGIFIYVSKQKTSNLSTQSSNPLQGFWRIESLLSLDESGQLKDVTPPEQRQNTYFEFGEKTACLDGRIDENGVLVPCQTYDSLTIEGNTVKVVPTRPIPQGLQMIEFAWSITNGKLELTPLTGSLPQKIVLVKIGERNKTQSDAGQSFIPSLLEKLPIPSSLIPSSITMKSPNGGECLEQDSTYFIRWDSTLNDFQHFNLDYTTDNFNYLFLVEVPPSTYSYSWVVPKVDSQKVIVRVVGWGPAGYIAEDSSDTFLSIRPSCSAP